jgi:predicted  nucleic acid-binding Zn-ribbon protein
LASLKFLYELQTLDLRISTIDVRLRLIIPKIGDESPLGKTRQVAQSALEQLGKVRTQQNDAEITLQQYRDKFAALEKKMYDGSVRNPRELSGMQEDSGYLHRHQEESEDALLNIMVSLEDQQRIDGLRKKELFQAEEVWKKEQEKLVGEMQVLKKETEHLQKQRLSLAAQVDEALLRTYDRLWKSHGGRVVARADRGTCEVCGITLSSREQQQALTSSSHVQCGNCGRLLFVR